MFCVSEEVIDFINDEILLLCFRCGKHFFLCSLYEREHYLEIFFNNLTFFSVFK